MKGTTLNSFNEGLISDLNALVTPNTVMTDCLNGTLISYNGNEYVLQNDMGNGKVETAYLPQGYVPVGMKEHGGIIYVASYNPLTQYSLVGCFPSPERNIEGSDHPDIKNDLNFPAPLTDTSSRLFKKDITIKPGNRLGILLLDLDTSKITPNFINSSGAPYSGRNRRYNISLNVINSNGILQDVTTEVCKPIIFVGRDYYFFKTSGTLDETTDLFSYTSKLSGVPYIKLTSNRVKNWEVSIVPKRTDSEDNLDEDGNPTKTTVTAEFNILYKYNGPILTDGLVGFRISGDVNGTIDVTRDLIQGTILDQDGLYTETLNVKDPITLFTNINIDSKKEIILTPLYDIDGKCTTSELQYKVTLDISKIGTDYNEINTWRYYIDDKYATITWGMESYPSKPENAPKNVKFEFYDISNMTSPSVTVGGEVAGVSALDLSNYNGMFTTLVPIGNGIEELTLKHVYLVKISWILQLNISKEKWRFVICTGIDNGYYWFELDFINRNDHTWLLTPEFEVNLTNSDYKHNINNYPILQTGTTTNSTAVISDKYKYSFDIKAELKDNEYFPFSGVLDTFEWKVYSVEFDESLLKSERIAPTVNAAKQHDVSFEYLSKLLYTYTSDTPLRVEELFKTYSVRDFSVSDLGNDFPLFTLYVQELNTAGHDPDFWIGVRVFLGNEAESPRGYEKYETRHGHSDDYKYFSDFLEPLKQTTIDAVCTTKYPLLIGMLFYAKDQGSMKYNFLIWNGEKYIFAYSLSKTAGRLKWNYTLKFDFKNKALPYDKNNGALKDVAVCVGSLYVNDRAHAALLSESPEGNATPIKEVEAHSIDENVTFRVNHKVTIKYGELPYNALVKTSVDSTNASNEDKASIKSALTFKIPGGSGSTTDPAEEEVLTAIQLAALININDTTGIVTNTSDKYKIEFDLWGVPKSAIYVSPIFIGTYSLNPKESSGSHSAQIKNFLDFELRDIKGGDFYCSDEQVDSCDFVMSLVNEISGNTEVYEQIRDIETKGVTLLLAYKNNASSVEYIIPLEELDPNMAYDVNQTTGVPSLKEDVVVGSLYTGGERHAFLPSKNLHPKWKDWTDDGEGRTTVDFGSMQTAGLS